MKKRWNNWYLLYAALLAILLFSLLGIPRLAVGALEEAKGRIVTVEAE